MKEYNYRFVYDSGQYTELLKCSSPFVMNDSAKWYKINMPEMGKSIIINIDKVVTIEEWITEE